VSELHDIAVLGATPAGCAAASLLARKHTVVLVEYPGPGCESPLADWVPRDFWRLPGVAPVTERSCGGSPFRTVRYHDPKLTRTVQLAVRPSGGSLLQRDEFVSAMIDSARKAGAKLCHLPRRPLIRLGEDSVLLAGTRNVAARLLLIAQGSPHEAMGDLSLPGRPAPRSTFAVAGLDAPISQAKQPEGLEGTLNLVASRERGKLGMFFVAGGRLHLRLVWSAGDARAAVTDLSAFLSDLQKAGLAPRDLSLSTARGAVWRPPAGEALELETHAAKRCLLLGTAGGFADSITGQTLYPSVRSAAIAAKAAQAALSDKDPQDALLLYKNEWRKAMADNLRPPSTSVDMLLPLLLGNRRLVAKFTRAMLYGQNI
jgi:flavin-dependent dehydrogenase